MQINIQNTESFHTGAYILNKDVRTYAAYKNSKSIFLTQEDNSSLKSEILKLIHSSKQVLKICSFIITDTGIYEAILDKIKNSNTAIFILTQLDANKLKTPEYLTEEELFENSSNTHLRNIQNLSNNGVHVRASVTAHAKFIIADRTIGFITSANLTSASLQINTESGTYMGESGSRELDKLFDAIYQKGTTYRHFIRNTKKNSSLIVQAETSLGRDKLPDPTVSDLKYTYDKEVSSLYDEIVSIIKNAEEYLYLSTYSIVGVDSLKELTEAITEAHGRGVKINVFCRGMNYRNDHLHGSQILSSCGCDIYADVFNHSKGILSEKRGMLFTANIDGMHGLKNGFEVGAVLTEAQRCDFLDVNAALIKTAVYKFQNKPIRADLFHTYTNYETVKDINSPDFPPDITISVAKALSTEISDLCEVPLFYGKSSDEEYIIAGDSFYKCTITDGNFIIYDKNKATHGLKRYLLKYINLKIISH